MTQISLSSLRSGPSVRQELDDGHVFTLREIFDRLPAITVRKIGDSYEIIDGHHRRQAAALLQRTSIAVEVIECSDADAVLRAIEANIAHGRPLSLNDRKHAARQLIGLNAEWSDAWIAERCGLRDVTVAELRPRPTSQNERLDTRVGRDQKRRPATVQDATARREQVATIVAEHPNKSLREVADEVGVSPETVRFVKKRLEREGSPEAVPSPSNETSVADVVKVIPNWTKDEACQRSEQSYAFAKWFQSTLRSDYSSWSRHEHSVPAEHREVAAGLAEDQASYWTRFAAALRSGSQLRRA